MTLPLSFFASQSGEIEILNHKTNERCILKFVPYSYFSRDVARKVGNTLLYLLSRGVARMGLYDSKINGLHGQHFSCSQADTSFLYVKVAQYSGE